MLKRLPEFIDPWRSADQKRVFSGRIELAEMSRVAEALMSNSGDVEFELNFERDNKRRSRIKGFVRSTLVVECQRCLGALSLPVDSSLNLAVVEGPDEAELLPEEIDPVQVEEGMIRLLDLIEDELLLSIPQVPMHDVGECETDISAHSESFDSEPEADETDEPEQGDNPFAVLAQLKKDS